MQAQHTRAQQTLIGKLDQVNSELTNAIQVVQTEARRAYASETTALLYAYVSDIQMADRMIREGDYRSATNLLRRHSAVPDTADQRDAAWHALWQLCHKEPHVIDQFDQAGYCVCISADGSLMVACGADGTLRLYSNSSQQVTATSVSTEVLSSDEGSDKAAVAGPPWRRLQRIDGGQPDGRCVV
ncbi:MAG TPA: hypothetical protein EYG03_29440 [Planctomycetes bacterium]|nr:hypothetical protein [Fuerstiella sp.]HIK96088.1 hypothetical protein [Planctomycetota bacterium]